MGRNIRDIHILVIGEILFDVYPHLGTQKLGGAPFNFAFHLHKLGCQVSFMSRVGNDPLGAKILSFLHQHSFPTDMIQIDPHKPTGQVTVSLDEYGSPIYSIQTDSAYDYIEFTSPCENIFKDNHTSNTNNQFDYIYIGTLAQRSQITRETIRSIILRNDTSIFYDINLRKPFYETKLIKDNLHRCQVLKINDEELNILRDIIHLEHTSTYALAELSLTYSIPSICLTRGEKGSLLFHKEQIFEHVLEPENIKDAVGAGDAFSAILALGLILDWSPSDILRKASRMAFDICQLSGAIAENDVFYNQVLGYLTNS